MPREVTGKALCIRNRTVGSFREIGWHQDVMAMKTVKYFHPRFRPNGKDRTWHHAQKLFRNGSHYVPSLETFTLCSNHDKIYVALRDEVENRFADAARLVVRSPCSQ